MANDSCNTSEWQVGAIEALEVSAYHVLPPIYIILGTATNAIFLTAFYQRAKLERPYGYQVAFTISKTLQTLTFGFYLICGKWLHYKRVKWFVSNYILLSFYRVGLGLHVSFFTSTVLLSVAMAADRLFAIARPLVYRKAKHLRHQATAVTTSFVMGFMAGGMLFFDVKLKRVADAYEAYFDQDLEHSIPGQAFFYWRMVSRVGGVLVLLVLNIIMIKVFKKRKTQVAAIISKQNQEGVKSCEKTLLLINIYQGCFTLLNQLPHVVWQCALFILPPSFELCEGRIVGPICDGVLMLTDTFDFFVLMLINKRMRQLVSSTIPGLCRRPSVPKHQ